MKIITSIASLLFFSLNYIQAQTNIQVCCDTAICTPGSPVHLSCTVDSGNTGSFLVTLDDTYSQVVNLGFSFTFFGNPYSSCVLSTNAYITFENSLAFGYSPWQIFEPAPSPNNPLNAIYGPWHDVDPAVQPYGTVAFGTFGTAPNRFFIYNFCSVPMFLCNDTLFTGQIILYEGTNIIETHIGEKRNCSAFDPWNNNAAIHGLQDSTGTVAVIVPGRNYPQVWTAFNEGTRFTPNGSTYDITFIPYAPIAFSAGDVEWTDEFGNIVGTGFDITVNPSVTTQYIATLASCGFSSDTATITVGTVPVELGNDTSICQGDSLMIDAGNSGATFNWSNGSTAQSIVVNSPGIYTVVVTSGGCTGTDSLQLSLVNCPNSQSSFGSSTTSVCQKFCISFFDSSFNNPTSWLWLFPGGSPSSSTSQNPPPICYNDSGTFDVTLITTSTTGVDTLVLLEYITVYPTPVFPVITQNDDTLTASLALTYQWQFNSVDIPGATNQSYVATQSGLYGVVISDENGCSSSSTTFLEISGISNTFSDSNVVIYPNPSNGIFVVKGMTKRIGDEMIFEVIDQLGQTIYLSHEIISTSFEKVIDLNKYGTGCFLLRIGTFASPGEWKDEFIISKILIAD